MLVRQGKVSIRVHHKGRMQFGKLEVVTTVKRQQNLTTKLTSHVPSGGHKVNAGWIDWLIMISGDHLETTVSTYNTACVFVQVHHKIIKF